VTNLRPLSSLELEILDGITIAIDDELGDESAETVAVWNGRIVGTSGKHRLWSFELDAELSVLPDTPAQLLKSSAGHAYGTIVAIGELDLVFSTKEVLDATEIATAQLSIEPDFILRALRARITDLIDEGIDSQLVNELLDVSTAADIHEHPQSSHEVGPTRTDEPSEEAGSNETGGSDAGGAAETAAPDYGLNPEQQFAVDRSVEGGLRFVWGPPGTGKTSTLAATVSRLVREGKRVLVVSHSNAAIDVAMVRIADEASLSDELESGRVVRFGTSRSAEAQACTQISIDEILRRREPLLVATAHELSRERNSLSTKLKRASSADERRRLSARLAKVRSELEAAEESLKELRTVVLSESLVIGATLSSVVVHGVVWNQDVDAVVVDEASMAGLPFLMALAMRGAEHFICFGDFRQLPPIAVSPKASAQQWFGRDVFELAGVAQRIEAGESDPRTAVLLEQYRMGADIAQAVSHLAYFDMLRTHESAADRARPIAAAAPAEDAEIVIIDLGPLQSACQRERQEGTSRFNPISAALCISLASGLLEFDVDTLGIATPYRAQMGLLRSAVRGDERITAATTHRFQGSERDAIIFDMVDAAPQTGPSMLTGSDLDLSLRLLNVAASRARGKLLIVVDLVFLADHSAPVAPSRQLVENAIERGAPVVNAADLIGQWGDATDTTTFWQPTWTAAVTAGIDKAEKAPTFFDVSLPSANFDGEWLQSLSSSDSDQAAGILLRAPIDVAARYEDSSCDLRLQTLGPGPLLFIGSDVVVVGGQEPNCPAVVVTSQLFVKALRQAHFIGN